MVKIDVKAEAANLHKATRAQITTLIISAFGLVAALAWNTAIQGIFVLVFGPASSIGAMLSYAILVTVIAVIVTVYLSRLNSK